MEVKLLGFVQECNRLAKEALGKDAGSPAGSMLSCTASVLRMGTAIESSQTGLV